MSRWGISFPDEFPVRLHSIRRSHYSVCVSVDDALLVTASTVGNLLVLTSWRRGLAATEL